MRDALADGFDLAHPLLRQAQRSTFADEVPGSDVILQHLVGVFDGAPARHHHIQRSLAIVARLAEFDDVRAGREVDILGIFAKHLQKILAATHEGGRPLELFAQGQVAEVFGLGVDLRKKLRVALKFIQVVLEAIPLQDLHGADGFRLDSARIQLRETQDHLLPEHGAGANFAPRAFLDEPLPRQDHHQQVAILTLLREVLAGQDHVSFQLPAERLRELDRQHLKQLRHAQDLWRVGHDAETSG
mmetsp:Transcript_125768/g.361599  ORF Transcript_125768/g.361599 Transcript_125768/m.361599 type:complete len:244 (+) Transcript_125768:1336-2067(+)